MAGFSGRCLCGGVTFESKTDPQLAAHCYCVDCRKSSGTGHCTHLVAEEATLTIQGTVKFYDHPTDSGNMVSRGFCPNCGCAIYSKNSSMPGVVFPRASALDNPDVVEPQMSVYASRAPSWDHIDPALPSFDEMPDGSPQDTIDEHNLA